MKKIIFLLICITPFLNLFSQDSISKNAIYIEAFGNGIFGSINYERKLNIKNNKQRAIHIGGLFLPIKGETIISSTIEYNFLYGKSKHHLEWGFGVSNSIDTHKYNVETDIIDPINGNKEVSYKQKIEENVLYLSSRIGYRYEKPGGKFLFRVGLIPLIPIAYIYKENHFDVTYYKKEYFPKITSIFPLLPWFGVSFGYTF